MDFIEVLIKRMHEVRMRRGNWEPLKAIYVGYKEIMRLRSAPYHSGFEERNGAKSFRGVKVVEVNEENYLEVY